MASIASVPVGNPNTALQEEVVLPIAFILRLSFQEFVSETGIMRVVPLYTDEY